MTTECPLYMYTYHLSVIVWNASDIPAVKAVTIVGRKHRALQKFVDKIVTQSIYNSNMDVALMG